MKTSDTNITCLTQDELRSLFSVIKGKRDKAVLQLAYHHGLRASEVSLLLRDDINDKQGPRLEYMHTLSSTCTRTC